MIVLRTLAERWYVAAFLTGYVIAGVRDRGWKPTIRFGLLAFVVGFVAEYSSTRNGFPFTRFEYTAKTHGEELYLSNIPLFVPVAYGVMMYAGRSVAMALSRPRSSLAVVAAGAVCTMAVDVVVDPVAVRGEEWFLGDLFRYESGGQFFGVPLGNFGGWVLVSAIVIALDLALDRGTRTGARSLGEAIPLAGVALAGGVLVFNMGVALAIGSARMAITSIAVAGALFTAVALVNRAPVRQTA